MRNRYIRKIWTQKTYKIVNENRILTCVLWCLGPEWRFLSYRFCPAHFQLRSDISAQRQMRKSSPFPLHRSMCRVNLPYVDIEQVIVAGNECVTRYTESQRAAAQRAPSASTVQGDTRGNFSISLATQWGVGMGDRTNSNSKLKFNLFI